MTPPSAAPEPTPPPIREFPAEIEEALRRELTPDDLARYGQIAMGGFWEGYTEGDVVAIKRRWQQAAEAVITAYRAALDERDTALRERCERLRRVADVASLCGTTPDIVLEALADLHEDDYADDLRPRGGDQT